MTNKPLLITPGEPAGVGPDITLNLLQQGWNYPIAALADPELLALRAAQLNLDINILVLKPGDDIPTHSAKQCPVIPVPLNQEAIPGLLNPANADYVIRALIQATGLCQQNQAAGIITGPVHKAVINDAGIQFQGHTEFFATQANVQQTVMLFVSDEMRVALATTHLPLKDVPQAITTNHLQNVIRILQTDLQKHFQIKVPRIAICGLNPHAGESGHLGSEEIEVITPLITELNQSGYDLIGPLPADTIFTPKHLKECDAVLAMYHDQALPVVKHLGFGKAVNVTLGLPFIRTSVDHGTALDLAGTGKADPGSLAAALKLAIALNK